MECRNFWTNRSFSIFRVLVESVNYKLKNKDMIKDKNGVKFEKGDIIKTSSNWRKDRSVKDTDIVAFHKTNGTNLFEVHCYRTMNDYNKRKNYDFWYVEKKYAAKYFEIIKENNYHPTKTDSTIPFPKRMLCSYDSKFGPPSKTKFDMFVLSNYHGKFQCIEWSERWRLHKNESVEIEIFDFAEDFPTRLHAIEKEIKEHNEAIEKLKAERKSITK